MVVVVVVVVVRFGCRVYTRRTLVHKQQGAGIEVKLLLTLKPTQNVLDFADAEMDGLFPELHPVVEEPSQTCRQERDSFKPV